MMTLTHDIQHLPEIPNVDEIPDRSPSRIGFSRPPLLRTDTRTLTPGPSSDDEEWDLEVCTIAPPPQILQELEADEDIVPVETFSPSNSFDQLYPAGQLQYCGLSRQHLADTRSYWDLRRRRWMEWHAEQQFLDDASVAYDGIEAAGDHDNSLRPAVQSTQSLSDDGVPVFAASYSPHLPSLDETAPIYPRLGDLNTLHGSQFASLDHQYSKFPLNTIRRILFLHDMLRLAATDVCKMSFCACRTLLDQSLYTEADDSFTGDDSFVGDTSFIADSPYAGPYNDSEVTLVGLPDTQKPVYTTSGLHFDTEPPQIVVSDLDALTAGLEHVSLDDTPLKPGPTLRKTRRPKRKAPPKFFFHEDIADEFGFYDERDDSLYGELMARSISGPSVQFMSTHTLGHTEMMYY